MGASNSDPLLTAKKFAKEEGKPLPIIEIDVKAYGDRTYARVL